MTGSGKRLFCFGLGYSARALARLLHEEGWEVDGTTRDPGRAGQDAGQSARLHAYGPGCALDGAGQAALAAASHVLLSIPPDSEGDPVLRTHGEALAARSDIAWLGYLSTTGVYGDHGGAFVDETTPPAPTTERGRRRLAAEEGWRALWQGRGLPLHIFRLAGIYGPGRSAFDALRAGRARIIACEGQVFSRIHVEDIAHVLRASIARPRPGAIYNVCDDEPAPPGDVIREAARLLGMVPPDPVPLEEAGLSDMARSFYTENKRVDNGLLHQELGVSLRAPDYRRGLALIRAQEEVAGKA
ncbi:MAG: SDR family oxidoreductase [Rhodothalassiaceae bacterium]